MEGDKPPAVRDGWETSWNILTRFSSSPVIVQINGLKLTAF